MGWLPIETEKTTKDPTGRAKHTGVALEPSVCSCGNRDNDKIRQFLQDVFEVPIVPVNNDNPKLLNCKTPWPAWDLAPKWTWIKGDVCSELGVLSRTNTMTHPTSNSQFLTGYGATSNNGADPGVRWRKCSTTDSRSKLHPSSQCIIRATLDTWRLQYDSWKQRMTHARTCQWEQARAMVGVQMTDPNTC
jgi:hypothetical protein